MDSQYWHVKQQWQLATKLLFRVNFVSIASGLFAAILTHFISPYLNLSSETEGVINFWDTGIESRNRVSHGFSVQISPLLFGYFCPLPVLQRPSSSWWSWSQDRSDHWNFLFSVGLWTDRPRATRMDRNSSLTARSISSVSIQQTSSKWSGRGPALHLVLISEKLNSPHCLLFNRRRTKVELAKKVIQAPDSPAQPAKLPQLNENPHRLSWPTENCNFLAPPNQLLLDKLKSHSSIFFFFL